ncbi:hypothetical protein KAI87_01290 [Myxococcota bacterium]|nr:hypothetical protein [Myxococcota bacterium]
MSETLCGEIEKMAVIANNPNLNEIEAFVVGDIFDRSSVYYLALGFADELLRVQNPTTGALVTKTVSLPATSLLKVTLKYDKYATPVWETTSGPSPLSLGFEATTVGPDEGFEPFSCDIDGESWNLLASSQHLSPTQFILSEDSRYLAYSKLAQRLSCLDTGSSRQLTFGAPVFGDVYVIDLQVDAIPKKVYSSECIADGTLYPLNSMPVFISGGQQLVFSSKDSDDPSKATFFRFNLSDLSNIDEASCAPATLKQLATTETLQTVLQDVVDDNIKVLGASVEDSRSGLDLRINCSALRANSMPLWFILVGGAFLLRVRSRKKTKT